MSHVPPETIDLSSLLGLFNPSGLYAVGYAWLCGMSIWVSFIGGVIALKTLPRHQFGTLQHRTFPVYFSLSIALTAGLLGLWSYSHPNVVSEWSHPSIPDAAQAYALAFVILCQAGNHFVVGPMTSRVMFQRHKQEKEEGKGYEEPSVSNTMKSLNVQFATLHGISSFANLFAVIAVLFHGLWLGNYGFNKV